MSALIRKIWFIIFGGLWRHEDAPVVVPALPTPKVMPKHNYGVLSSLSGLLDELDAYFGYIKTYKKYDADGYNLYSKVGGRILTESSLLAVGGDDWKFAGVDLPSFGMVSVNSASGHDADDTKMYPRLWSFRKIKNTPNIEHVSGGQLFDVTVVWIDSRRKVLKPKPYGATFYVHVNQDGTARLLKESKNIELQLPRSRKKLIKHQKNHGSHSLLSHCWQLPGLALEMYEEHKARCEKNRDYIEPDVHAYFGTLLRAVLSPFVFGEGGFRINCKKGSLMGVFNIDAERSPYFFRSREKTVNVNGRTRPIFHAVRSHKRANDSTVKMHFRGERQFVWNGYSINISVPGKHHADLINLTVSADTIDNDVLVPEGYLDHKALGILISEHISGGVSP